MSKSIIEQELEGKYNHLSKQYKGLDKKYKELKDLNLILIEENKLLKKESILIDVEKMIESLKFDDVKYEDLFLPNAKVGLRDSFILGNTIKTIEKVLLQKLKSLEKYR